MRIASCRSARDPQAACAWRLSSPVSSQGEERVNDSRSIIVLFGDVEERILVEVRRVEPGSSPGVQAQLHPPGDGAARDAGQGALPAPGGRRRRTAGSGCSSRQASWPRRFPQPIIRAPVSNSELKNGIWIARGAPGLSEGHLGILHGLGCGDLESYCTPRRSSSHPGCTWSGPGLIHAGRGCAGWQSEGDLQRPWQIALRASVGSTDALWKYLRGSMSSNTIVTLNS